MNSYTYNLPSDLSDRFVAFFKGSSIPRFAVVGIVIVLAVIVGPRGLAVGPSQTRSMSPALPTGAAMETQAVLDSIPLSFDLVTVSSVLVRNNASYPERQVGPLRFPQGAIDVPWAAAVIRPRENADLVYSNTRISGPAGSTVSAPRRNNIPQVSQTAVRRNNLPEVVQTSVQANQPLNQPLNGMMDNGDWRSVVIFDQVGADLTSRAVASLDEIAGGLRGTGARIQLLAYGGSTAERSHSARRLALRRALAVRNYLMLNGIDQEQIAVRALGGASDGGPASRVDVIIPTR